MCICYYNSSPAFQDGSSLSDDGKKCFIGCSGWKKSEDEGTFTHRFIPIPLEVNEDLVRQLFQNNGQLKISAQENVLGSTCGVVVARRVGAKGNQRCRKLYFLTIFSLMHVC